MREHPASDMKDDANEGLIALLTLIAIPFLLAVSLPWSGFVLAKLWWWFVVPLFAVTPLTIWQAAGLSLFVSFLTYKIRREIKKKDRTAKEIAADIFGPWANAVFLVNPWVLLIGWILKRFV